MKRFPCPYCNKICKSKGGLTNHMRRMHADDGEARGDAALPKIPKLSSEAVDNMLADIKQKLHEDNLYPKDILAEVEKLNQVLIFMSHWANYLRPLPRISVKTSSCKNFMGGCMTIGKHIFHLLRMGNTFSLSSFISLKSL